ncbi:MAG TPA: histidine kinase, partial [Terriglobia bacterium]|nr:histidine kinase [Terriglobia bacterium]
WIWAALTPGVLWLSARFPLERRHWGRRLAVHIPASFLFAALHMAIRLGIFPAAGLYTTLPAQPSWTLFKNMLSANAYDDIWMYGSLLAFSQLWNYYRKYQERELRASRLEAQLAQAQLQVLRMQLDPHFLFNTLHAISSLMHEDVEAADEVVTRLSDLLRMSLENVNQNEVTLQREMEFLEGYLAIQQTRFRDRLTVRLDIEPVSLDALVPSMILQPLVENAVTHGIASRLGPGEIAVRARRRNGVLRLEVADNGPGPGSTGEKAGRGLGISNTRARLTQLYGAAQRFELTEAAGGGTLVALELPFRVVQAGAPGVEPGQGGADEDPDDDRG